MKIAKLIIVVLLALVVFGGGSYFIYDSFHPYRRFANMPPPPTWVHPMVAQIKKARQLRAEGKLVEAQQLLLRQLHLDPNAPPHKEARQLLGEINTEMFFSPDHLFGKSEYVVRRGDSLWRIAHKLNSSPDLIRRTNNLESDRLHPGDRLLVPEADFTLTLDLPNERAVVHHGDGFLTQYPIVSVDLPRSHRTEIITRIAGSTFWKDGERLKSPTAEERAASTPWIRLGHSGYILYGVSGEDEVTDSAVQISDEGKDKNPDYPPNGIALWKDDLEQIETLLERGTPVTIIRKRE